jgi:hypothetical protein
MTQTSAGAIKALSNKSGIPLPVFIERISQGLKWCYKCEDFHPVDEFGNDSSRYDGLTPLCSKSRNERQRKQYVLIPPESRKPHGPKPGSASAKKLGIAITERMSKRKREWFTFVSFRD